MLGENHSLIIEIPKFKELITKLIEQDPSFACDSKRYCVLDKEIRTLELECSPIIDTSMHQLKHDRSVLKDSLYQRLLHDSK